jgi:hypothetical protein
MGDTRQKQRPDVRLTAEHKESIEQAAALLTPEVQGDRLVLTLSEPDASIRALLAAITPPFVEARARAQRKQSMDQLKQLGLAMHNYHYFEKSFPAAGNADADGHLLLS